MYMKVFLIIYLLMNLKCASSFDLLKKFLNNFRSCQNNTLVAHGTLHLRGYIVTDNLKPCDQNRLMLRLSRLYAISPERIMMLATTNSLDDTCQNIVNTATKVKIDFQNCKPLSETNLYMKLFKSLQAFQTNFCQNDSRAEKVNLYHSCLQELHEEYLDCEGPADWFDISNKTFVCKTFLDILNCNYVKTAELCGLDIAFLMRSASIDIFRPVISFDCDLPKALPRIMDPMPGIEHGKFEGRFQSLWYSVALFIILFILVVLVLLSCFDNTDNSCKS